MLSIGTLVGGAAEYYIGEVATSKEDYYAGHGEGLGRWVGSLAHELGLEGEVDPVHFRRVLNGQHPHSGEYLVSAQGSSARARTRAHDATAIVVGLPEAIDTLRAAAHLGVSRRYVTQLLVEGDAYRRRLAEHEGATDVAEPSAYLLGNKVDGDRHDAAWIVTRDELERFAARRREINVRSGYDLTLRPPKSVSVLWALAEPDRRAEISRAHTEAVDEVVRYYEGQAVFVRQGGGKRRLVPAAGIVAAAFDHRTSRAGDPLLHTHIVSANMTCATGPTARRWRTIPGGGLFEHAKAAGHLYQAHLRHLLATRLRLEFTPVVNGHADVVGVSDPVVEVFSKRRAEITELLSKTGRSSARAAQIATLQTRKTKDYDVDAETLEQRWRIEAAEVGFDHAAVGACFDRAPRRAVNDDRVDTLYEALGGPFGLTERSATFSRTDVIESVASSIGSAVTARRIEEIADGFLSSRWAQLVDRGPVTVDENRDVKVQRDTSLRVERARVPRSGTQKLYTTPELAELEERLLQWSVISQSSSRVAAGVLDAVITERPELSDEQQTMVRAACTAGELIQPISGRPGAGKTYAMEAVVAAFVAEGAPIIGASVSASAAAELERAAGFARSTGAPASTVAALLVNLDGDEGGLRPRTVVVVDEASMVATRDLVRLASAVRTAGGAIKLIGDPDQHGSVDVGGAFRRMCADRGHNLVALVENNRQQDHGERLAVNDYREGRIDEALSRYDEAGKIVRSRTAGESFDAIVADWYAARVLGKVDPMIAGPNSTRRALNDRARAMLKATGDLVGRPLTVAGREFMVGDDVVARRNDRSMHVHGSRAFVKNGSAGTVTAIDDDELVVAFEREGVIRVSKRYLEGGHLEHGYARTSYGVQGTTHDVAHYHPTDVSSFEEGYVAITRARNAARIYVVDGDLPLSDDDLSHSPEQAEPFGVSEIALALNRRRSGHMAADAADELSAVAGLTGRSLGALTARRRQLQRALEAAPPSTVDRIEASRQIIEAIRARQRTWQMQIDAVGNQEIGAKPDGALVGTCVQRATSAIGQLGRSSARVRQTLVAAVRQQAARDEWLAEHADVVSEYALVRRAERRRETQIRVAAVHRPLTELIDLIGTEPDLQRDKHTWRRAVEEVVVYRERYGIGDETQSVLGERPRDLSAVSDYERAAAALAQARSIHVAAEMSSSVEL